MTRPLSQAVLTVSLVILICSALCGCDRTRPYVAPGIDTPAAATATAPPATAPAPGQVLAQPPTRTPRGWRFSYADNAASSVHLAGDFNEWSNSANPLTRGESGIWYAVLELEPGTYQYKFVVNGSDWKVDPTNENTVEDGYGGENSVVEVP